MNHESVPATLFRGGTSKGVYFLSDDLPDDRTERERLLLRSFGSPDPMQIDGVGGSHSTASKAMIVSSADDRSVDVEYLFAQVGIEKPVVDWGGNCGNLTFAVGPYAIERGLVAVDPGADAVDLVLRNANTGTVVEQRVPLGPGGSPRYDGDFRVYGVPTTGARIRSRFLDPGGSVTGSSIPTGNRIDRLDVDGLGRVEVSLVDVASPCAFVRASDVGLTGTELPHEIDGDESTLERLERIRGAACERLGIVDDRAAATAESPGIPKMALVGERRSYRTSTDERVETDDFDLLARIMSMQKAHHAYAVTGAMCTAAAASIPGTIPSAFLRSGDRASTGSDDVDRIVIGHPKGTLDVRVAVDGERVRFASVDRTARQLFDGELFYFADEGDGRS